MRHRHYLVGTLLAVTGLVGSGLAGTASAENPGNGLLPLLATSINRAALEQMSEDSFLELVAERSNPTGAISPEDMATIDERISSLDTAIKRTAVVDEMVNEAIAAGVPVVNEPISPVPGDGTTDATSSAPLAPTVEIAPEGTPPLGGLLDPTGIDQPGWTFDPDEIYRAVNGDPDQCPSGDYSQSPLPRPGTIFTPTRDTFVLDQPGHLSRFAFGLTEAGDFRVRNNPARGNREEFLVCAHVNSDFNVRLDELNPIITVSDFNGAQLLKTSHASKVADGIDIDLVPYANQAPAYFPTWPRTNPTKIGYAPWAGQVKAWLPSSLLARPGVQIDVQISEDDSFYLGSWGPDFFTGADRTTVHIGSDPVAHDATLTEAAGVWLDANHLVDRDARPDLESQVLPTSIRQQLSDTVNDAVGNPGRYIPVLGGLRMTGFNMPAPFIDLDLKNTGAEDAVLVGEVSARNIHVSLKWGLLQARACNSSADIDVQVKVEAFPRRNPSNPADLDITVKATDVSVWIHNTKSSIYPVKCNFWGGAARGPIERGIEKALRDGINKQIDNGDLLDRALKGVEVASFLKGTIGAPGPGFSVAATGFAHGCTAPCTGNDVALLSPKGLELVTDLKVTDNKVRTWGTNGRRSERRFPLVERGATATSMQTLAIGHADPSGATSTVGLVASDALINQILRSITEGTDRTATKATRITADGLLDIRSNQPFVVNGSGYSFDTEIHPTVAPILLPTASGTGPTIYVPDLRVTLGAVGLLPQTLFSVDAWITMTTTAGAGGPVSVAPTVRVAIHTLKCFDGSFPSNTWNVCAGPSSIPGGLETYLNTTVFPKVATQSIGQFTLPKVAGGTIANFGVRRGTGTLGLYFNVN